MRTAEEAKRGRGHSPSPQMATPFSYLSAGAGWAELRTTADSDRVAGLNPAPKRCAGAPVEIRMERLNTTAPHSISVPPLSPSPRCMPPSVAKQRRRKLVSELEIDKSQSR